jgi:hypothetical protein
LENENLNSIDPITRPARKWRYGYQTHLIHVRQFPDHFPYFVYSLGHRFPPSILARHTLSPTTDAQPKIKNILPPYKVALDDFPNYRVKADSALKSRGRSIRRGWDRFATTLGMVKEQSADLLQVVQKFQKHDPRQHRQPVKITVEPLVLAHHIAA